MRFLSNIYDPTHENARRYHTYTSYAFGDHAAMEREWQAHLDWVNKFVVGEPKATDTYTVEQLKAMNYVGVYAPEGE